MSDDAYLDRIDDRINWRLTHVSLSVADVKYLFNVIKDSRSEVASLRRVESAARAVVRALPPPIDLVGVPLRELDAALDALTSTDETT